MEAQRADVISAGQVLKLLRVAILGVLLLGITGTVIELLLLEHDEADKPLQFVPLILIAAGVAAIIWELAELAQSEFELASRFVAAPESNQRVGWLGRADLGV